MTVDEAIKELNTFKIGAKSELGETALDMAIKALEREPCEDCISRQDVLDLIEHYNSSGLCSVFYGYDNGVKFAKAINKLPSVNPTKEKTGHWLKYKHMIYCSECGASIEAGYLNDMKYCYNCRARMESEDE